MILFRTPYPEAEWEERRIQKQQQQRPRRKWMLKIFKKGATFAQVKYHFGDVIENPVIQNDRLSTCITTMIHWGDTLSMQLFFCHFSSSYKTIKQTANHRAKKQTHVVDACIRPLPLTTTHDDHFRGEAYCYSEESERRQNRINRWGDENEEIVQKKGHTTSVLGNWFGCLESDQTQTSIRCKICRQPVLAELQTQATFSTISKGPTPQSTQKALFCCYFMLASSPE